MFNHFLEVSESGSEKSIFLLKLVSVWYFLAHGYFPKFSAWQTAKERNKFDRRQQKYVDSSYWYLPGEENLVSIALSCRCFTARPSWFVWMCLKNAWNVRDQQNIM
jgi:hypothetical protein